MNRCHMRPKRFAGAVIFGERRANVMFLAEVSAAGMAKLRFDPLPRDDSNNFLITAYQDQLREMRFLDFTLVGEARDGSTFHSARMQIQSLGGHFSNIPFPALKLSAFCLECTITRLAPSSDRAVVKTYLTGFEIAEPVLATCPLGTVELRGPSTLKAAEKARLTGELVIAQPAAGAPFEAWKSEALALLTHVQSIMSFARGRRLSAPITEVAYDGRVEMTIAMVIPQDEHGDAVFSPYDYGPIFRQAVASRFFKSDRAKEISVAIAWFGMPSSYREAKLISAMTVLENLLTKNLDKSDLVLRPPKQFTILRREISAAVMTKFQELGMTEDAIEDELTALNPKLEDLNRRALKEKISILAERWGVPMEGIIQADLGKAKRARDWIVHRGQGPEEESPADMMGHVRLIRELVVRFILTALAFEGMYISPMTGAGAYHRIMPPTDLK